VTPRGAHTTTAAHLSLSAFELVMNSVLQSYTSSLLPCTMHHVSIHTTILGTILHGTL